MSRGVRTADHHANTEKQRVQVRLKRQQRDWLTPIPSRNDQTRGKDLRPLVGPSRFPRNSSPKVIYSYGAENAVTNFTATVKDFAFA